MRPGLLPIGILLFSFLWLRAGTATLTFSLPWMLTSLTPSSFLSSLVIAGAQLGYILGGLCGGHMVDRMGAARTITAAGILGSVTIAPLALLDSSATFSVWGLTLLVTSSTLFDAGAATALDSRVPDLTSLANLPLTKVVAGKSSLGYTIMLIVPWLASISSKRLGISSTLLFSALALLLGGMLAGVTIASLGSPQQTNKSGKSISLFVGFIPLLQDKMIRFLLTACLANVSVVAATNSVLVPRLLHGSESGLASYGLFLSAGGMGSLVGSLVYGMVGSRIAPWTILRFCLAILTLSLFILSIHLSTGTLLTSGVMTGLATSPLFAALSVMLYEHVPVDRRGRALGALSVMIICLTPLILCVFGWIGDALGAETSLIILALILFLALGRLALTTNRLLT